jgi:SAM-dependent methyltransferase
MTESMSNDQITERVRERYSKIAEAGDCGCACGGTAGVATSDTMAERIGYDAASLVAAPEGANLGLGCGAPIGHLDLKAGETVLDLGSGAGFDAFLAAREVGPTGKVIGVDMTPAMLERARANAAKSGMSWVEFREGRLEKLPVDTGSIDAITSNCVINLAPDKAQVFREAARVLRRHGRMVVSDIVLDAELPAIIKDDLEAYVGCIGGAILRNPYFGALENAGFAFTSILKDVDFLATMGEDAVPQSLRDKMEVHGLELGDLAGIVRSITYRAVRR